MSLIAEDGTGLSTAESYISVADATAYFSARAITAWAALASDVREAAFRKATEYMISTYRNRWQGLRTYPLVQSLCWPRYGVVVEGVNVEDNVIPETIKRACAELALKSASANLSPDLKRGVLSKTIGPMTTVYDPNPPQQTRYKAIEAMLAPYLKAGGSGIMMKLERA
jgi:hypothetical protein